MCYVVHIGHVGHIGQITLVSMYVCPIYVEFIKLQRG